MALAVALAMLLGDAAPTASSRKPHPKLAPTPLVMHHVSRRETLVLRPDARLRFPAGSQRRFNRFMRCHHTGRQHAMAPRLLGLLAKVARHFEGRRLLIISGYRAPKVARNPHSPHKQGLAVDFRVDGVSNTELRDYCRSGFARVGVGYYPNSSFVHLDVRKGRSAFWIDYSGPGDAPLYSATPDDDLKNGRADLLRPGLPPDMQGESEAAEVGAAAKGAEASQPLPGAGFGGRAPQP